MLLRIITTIETFASVVVLIFSLRPNGKNLTPGQGVLIGLAIASFIVMIILELLNLRSLTSHSQKNEDQINNYMFHWIKKGGRVEIFTRDMSWAINEKLKSLLLSKAIKKELTIFVPSKTDFSRELEKAGAIVESYEYLDYVPQSRFTIINKNRMDSYIAVGQWVNGKHVIEEYHLGENHVFTIANDLVEIIRRFNKIRG